MLRTIAFAAAALALAAGCAGAPKKDSSIVIGVGPDGQMTVMSAGDTEADQMLAALLQSALDGEFDPEDAGEPEALPEDEIWRADAAGNLTHIQSGGQCPARWGDYIRERTSIFQPDGTDVGCNYNGPNGKVMTFYVYQNDAALADELATTVETMKTRQPISTEAAVHNAPASRDFVARALAYETADGTKMRTSVFLADGGSWRLKIRLTCMAADASTAETSAGLALMGQADRLDSPRPPASADKPTPI